MKLLNPLTLTDAAQKVFTFESLETLRSFIQTEAKFWNAKYEHQSKTGLHVHKYVVEASNNLQHAINSIDGWTPNLKTWDATALNVQIGNLWSSYLSQLPNYWLWSGHTFIDPWLQSYKYSQPTGDGFIETILRKTTSHISQYDWLQGYLLAYEFLLQGESQINKRRHAEKISFSTIKNQLVEKKDELIQEVSDYQQEISQWKSNTEANIEEWHQKQIKLFDDTALEQSEDFHTKVSTWCKQIESLEKTYEEKLRLDGPATYWRKSAKKLRTQGGIWVLALSLTSVVTIVYISYFFRAWLLGDPIELKLQTLEGAVMFATILSAFAVLIRAFSRLAFSAFHLQRDAEEREQLTHLYLSLSNQTSVDEESRRVVLQALFSRSETGLLANEHGPAMPGIQDAISLASKPR